MAAGEPAAGEGGGVIDKTCLSYWFPKIEAVGLPVPRTVIVPMSQKVHRELFALLCDGRPPKEEMVGPFFDSIKDAVNIFIGYPCFLRTGLTSAKHSWNRTCYLPSPEEIRSHVISIVEFSVIADLGSALGLPCNIWAVREILPTKPYGVCKYFGDMPICREFRFFVDDDKVRCWHPYWPKSALERGGTIMDDGSFDYNRFCHVKDEKPLFEIASAAGKAVGGSWSVDILETEMGWYLIDMAEAHKSFHWKDCEQEMRPVNPPSPRSDTKCGNRRLRRRNE